MDNKFCKDCKWIGMTEASPASPVCGHEKGQCGTTDYLVFGETTKLQHHFSCTSMRAGICGTEGIYWEEKDDKPN